MVNRLDAHLSSSIITESQLQTRKMYFYLASALVIGVLPAAVLYNIVSSLGIYDTKLPCTPQLGDWLIQSGYASASYACVVTLVLVCISCAPGGEASSWSKMACLGMTAKLFGLGVLLLYAKGNYDFYVKLDVVDDVPYSCDETLYGATKTYLLGSYVMVGLVVLTLAVLKCLTLRKGTFKKSVGISMY